APTAVTAAPRDSGALVTWSAPAADGGTPITSYVVTASPGGRTCTWAGGPLSCSVSALSNGTAYTFRVQAFNSAGGGAASGPSSPVTPSASTAPGSAPGTGSAPGSASAVVATAPTRVGLRALGPTRARLTWRPPAAGGPVDRYLVRARAK